MEKARETTKYRRSERRLEIAKNRETQKREKSKDTCIDFAVAFSHLIEMAAQKPHF